MKTSELLQDLIKRLSSNIITNKEGEELVTIEHYLAIAMAIEHFKQIESEEKDES